MSLSLLLAAFILDLVLGDPQNWPHPVRFIGGMINRVQSALRARWTSQRALYWCGGVLWLVVVGVTFSVTWAVGSLAYHMHFLIGVMVETWLAYTILATRCLRDCAYGVANVLKSGSLEASRIQLSYIVGRDTSQLSREQIIRAVVETVAENTVDGVIAPLFYLFIGGVPLAMAYKAVNTLDSMVGYNNDKYRAIGCVSARIDDMANYLPARITWLLFTAAAFVLRLDYRSAFVIGWRDRYQHKSPNCAWAEAPVAGALGIRLGGPNVYFGQKVEKPWMGDEHRAVALNDIHVTVRLMMVAAVLAIAVFAFVFSFPG